MEPLNWGNLPDLSYIYPCNQLLQLCQIKINIENQLLNQILINSKLQQLFQVQENSQKEKSTVLPINSVIDAEENSYSGYHIPEIAKVVSISKKQSIKNETKNIPKNFGKAIITFAEQHPITVERALQSSNITYQQFLRSLKQKKKGINSIADLRNLWLDEKYVFAKEMRALSQYFLKRGALNYIFKSRISNHKGHIKYRKRMIKVLQSPEDFTYVKTD